MRRQLIIQLWIISRETYFYPQLCLSIIINIFPSTITSTYSYSYSHLYRYIYIHIYLNYLKMISRCSPHLEHTINNPSSSPKHFPSELPQPCGWNRWNQQGPNRRIRRCVTWSRPWPPSHSWEDFRRPTGCEQLFFWWEWHLCFFWKKSLHDEISWIFHGRTWEFHWTSLEFSWNK